VVKYILKKPIEVRQEIYFYPPIKNGLLGGEFFKKKKRKDLRGVINH